MHVLHKNTYTINNYIHQLPLNFNIIVKSIGKTNIIID